jgi:hypothetical protein
MGRLRSGIAAAAAIFSLWCFSGCGGHSQPGVSPFPARVSIIPATDVSVELGGVFLFAASAQNSTGTGVATAFIWASNNTSIVNVAPNGVACAGHWDIAFTTCTPGAIGFAQVTATAFGATSAPTYVFVHPPIDSVQVNGVLLNNVPIQEPCLSQGQTMTVEAHAYSQGSDITTSVGPFAWSANNTSVVKITPLVTSNENGNPAFPFATNQATVAAVTPGITQIYATASGVTSTTFYQPQYQNTSGVTSPLLDFFETCPIQNIALEVGPAGSQQTNQTSFVTSKGTAENATAVITDAMGNSSLQAANTPVLLNKIALTWTTTQPVSLATANGCTETCAISTPGVGAGSVTASCSPPGCNIGYPEVPVALSSASALQSCASFFQIPSCQAFIPLPVYATTAISGQVTGATSFTSALATSTGCQNMNPLDCSTGIYSVATNRNVASNASPLPFPPNSLLFDLAGDRAFMGSEVNGIVVNPTNVGTSNQAFISIGTVSGSVLSVSNTGSLAVFSDTELTPNQVFVANTAAAGSAATTILDINNATAAGTSPDGLKTYIFGLDSNDNPAIFIYSAIQGLQTITPAPPLHTTVNSIVFSNNAAFTYVVEPSLAGGGPAVTVYNNCVRTGNDPQIVADSFALTAPPVEFKPLADGVHFIALENNGTFDYITATITGVPVATVKSPATSLCPMTVTHTVQNFSLKVGQIDALNFFPSPDGTQLYVLASNRPSVLVYNFPTASTTGISLFGDATPVSGFVTADGGTVVIAGNDGRLHVVSTAAGGSDLNPPVSFPNLPNYLNPFCTFTPTTGPCTLNLLGVKP